MTTNAARFTMAAGKGKSLMEFGLRRAQGPDGAISASRYALMGGFTSTSNVLSAKLFGSKAVGTMAHSFIQSFSAQSTLPSSIVNQIDILAEAKAMAKELGYSKGNEGELVAFVAYAYAFPDNFLALIDTYDTTSSGLHNFLCVAAALDKAGHQAKGVRLDSGDLASLSKECRKEFTRVGEKLGLAYFRSFTIVASNDINERSLRSLNAVGHEIDSFGIGTNLVTCEAQPALGGVYKLVELNSDPRIKFSQDTIKITIPCAKLLFRLFAKRDGGGDFPVGDVLIPYLSKDIPKAGVPYDVFQPFTEERITCAALLVFLVLSSSSF
jgi:nicotinate phosphoribosyltransferase